jgi:hypothetical protein
MNGKEATTDTGLFGRIVGICSRLSIILGVLLGVTQLAKPLKEASSALQSAKLSSLKQVNEFVDADSVIRGKIKKFLEEWGQPNGPRVSDSLTAPGETGEHLYYSDPLSDMREVGRHYERMGTLVKLEYLDFDLIYEIIPFPDDFWAATAGFRDSVRLDHWSQGKGLPDFWKNFEDLRNRYEKKRAAERRK